MLILVFLIVLLSIPIVVRQERQRKADFKRRMKAFLAIGSQYDEVDGSVLCELEQNFANPSVSITPTVNNNSNSNPYRPPAES